MIEKQKEQSPGVQMVRINGAEVRRLRERKGLTQLYLATTVGVTTDTISRWENGRYPGVRQENGIKLASVLEVDLSDILEREQTPPQEVEYPVGSVVRMFSAMEKILVKSFVLRSSRAVAGALLVLVVGMLGWFFFWVSDPAATLRSIRHLPPHSPPGVSFPVLVEIMTSGDVPVPLLVKEQLPPGILLLASVPAAASTGSDTVKWLQKQAGTRQRFGYLVQYTGGQSAVLEFAGSAVLRKGGKLSVVTGGNRKFSPAPYHYADTNQDYRIDDDEILIVYDEYAGLPGFDIGIAEVEAIWMGSGYRWNAGQRQFEVLP